MATVTIHPCWRCGGPYVGPRNDLTCLNCGAQQPIAREREIALRAEAEVLSQLGRRSRP